MKKKFIITVSLFLMLNAYSCERKSVPQITGSSPEVSGEPVTISLGTCDDMSSTEKKLLEKMNESDINVDIRLYEYTETSEPSEKLNLDIISGDAPDVLYVPTKTMNNFIKAGYMTDMYPLLENSPALSRKDFLPNVIKGLDVDGKLPAVCDSFILSTAVAKTEDVGNDAENWTPQQALELFSTMPEDTAFLKNSDRPSDVSYYLMERLAVEAVDYRNNSCNFDGEYEKTLNFIENTPEILSNMHIVPPEKSLIEEVTIFGINSSVSIQTFADFEGKDVTFVGYPSENGHGYITYASAMLGITETSPHKEESFELISLMLSDNSANSYIAMGIPVLEKSLQNDLKISKYNQNSVNCPVFIGDEEVQMPEEKIQEVVDYIRNVEFDPYHPDPEIHAIIRQEFSKFMNGEISSQKCSDTLNDRISLYLSETN